MKMMSLIINDLHERNEALTAFGSEASEKIVNVPEGKLRIACNSGKYRYYKITDAKDTRGKYITKENIDEAKELAEKDYLQKLLRAIDKETKAIEKALSILKKCNTNMAAEDIFSSLGEARQEIIKPVIINNQEYAKRWEEESYNTNDFRPEEKVYSTKKGDMVRSKSEAMLADMYYDLGIPYRYEAELRLKNGKRVYPDFTLLDTSSRQEIYHEHMGLMDNEEYRIHNLQKIEEYRNNDIFVGKNLIITFESAGCPLNIRTIKKNMMELFSK